METKIPSDTLSAYREKSIDWLYDDSGGTVEYLDGEFYLFRMLSRIVDALEVLEKVKEALFTEESIHKIASGKTNKNHKKIMSAVRINPLEIQSHVRFFNINPKILVWIRVRGSIEIPQSINDGFGGNEFLEKINLFISSLQKELKDPEIKKASKRLERASNKNNKSLTNYIDKLFFLHSRLLVIRVDLGYKRFIRTSFSDPDQDLSYLHDHYSEINENRQNLIKYIKSASKEYSMVGYAWKLEYGAAKGYHYHLIFFLDGSRVRQDISIAQKIGKHWNDEITDGEGTHFICNLNKDYYKTCGVGMISHIETDKINNLKRASTYLTKVDRIIHACIPGHARCFGKGEIPKKLKMTGRPRRAPNQQTQLSEKLIN